MGAAGVDAAPVLQSVKHILDTMALSAGDRIVRDRYPARPGRGDAGRDAAFGKGYPEAAAIVAAIAEQFSGRRHGVSSSGRLWFARYIGGRAPFLTGWRRICAL